MIQTGVKLYIPPMLEELPAFCEDMLCDSPGEGGTEDLTYEAWEI